MKNRIHILIPALVLVMAVSTVVPAAAGIFGGSKDKNAEYPTKWRFHRSPAMNFLKGQVARDRHAGWELGGVRVHLTKNCRVVNQDGRRHVLREGDHVVIMGPRKGDLVVAWQIQVMAAVQPAKRAASEETVIWSEVDGTVGEGNGPR